MSLAVCQFLVGDFAAADFIHLLADGVQGVHGVNRLRAARDVKLARMIVLRAPGSSDVVGPAVLGSHVAEQPAGEAAAENFRRHRERRIILVTKLAAQCSNVEEGLRDVVLLGQENTGRGLFADFREGGNRRLRNFPIAEDLFQLGFHFGCGKIAVDFEQDVGWKVIAMVKIQHVLALDVVDVGVLDFPTIRMCRGHTRCC